MTPVPPPIPEPARRRLQAFAFDPMSTRLTGNRLHIDVPHEKLTPGPVGNLVQVADYDGSRKVWYHPVNLDAPAILAQGGLRPTEGDPRSHQQVVYAVAMSVIERFQRFMGRRFRWRGDRKLVIVPHAFEGANAYFDPDKRAVLCGYYHADPSNPGPNLPGQTMFTCLSVDIVAHEVTHALVHRLRPDFAIATNNEVFAWHEAFADLVALFHHFAFFEVVEAALAESKGEIDEGGGLLALAREFGESTGRGGALRSAIGTPPDPERFAAATEPHEAGAYFVAGVFDAYLKTFQNRTADLLRIATGGTGVLPPGHLHPDLVRRVALEAVRNADRFLGMVVRAFDYLPVVDVTFGDVVRSIVTADRALYPEDADRLRSTLVESLRLRGIYPRIGSLADDALEWPAPTTNLDLGGDSPTMLRALSDVIHSTTRDLDPQSNAGEMVVDQPEDPARPHSRNIARPFARWGRDHALELGFDPTKPVELAGFHLTYRQAADRLPHPEIILRFAQRRDDLEDQDLPERERLPIKAGTTIVAGIDGTVRRVVAKPLPLSDPTVLEQQTDERIASAGREHHEAGLARLAHIENWMKRTDELDALTGWVPTRAASRLNFASLHSVHHDEES